MKNSALLILIFMLMQQGYAADGRPSFRSRISAFLGGKKKKPMSEKFSTDPVSSDYRASVNITRGVLIDYIDRYIEFAHLDASIENQEMLSGLLKGIIATFDNANRHPIITPFGHSIPTGKAALWLISKIEDQAFFDFWTTTEFAIRSTLENSSADDAIVQLKAFLDGGIISDDQYQLWINEIITPFVAAGKDTTKQKIYHKELAEKGLISVLEYICKYSDTTNPYIEHLITILVLMGAETGSYFEQQLLHKEEEEKTRAEKIILYGSIAPTDNNSYISQISDAALCISSGSLARAQKRIEHAARIGFGLFVLNSQNIISGKTPLIYATLSPNSDSLKLVEFFLDQGANQTVKDVSGKTAVEHLRGDDIEVIEASDSSLKSRVMEPKIKENKIKALFLDERTYPRQRTYTAETPQIVGFLKDGSIEYTDGTTTSIDDLDDRSETVGSSPVSEASDERVRGSEISTSDFPTE